MQKPTVGVPSSTNCTSYNVHNNHMVTTVYSRPTVEALMNILCILSPVTALFVMND